MKGDLIEKLKEFDILCRQYYGENYELESRFSSFKLEYAELLDDRDLLRNDNLRLCGEIEL